MPEENKDCVLQTLKMIEALKNKVDEALKEAREIANQ